VTWLIRMCDMTQSYVWHDSFVCVTWLIRMRDMTHSYVWHRHESEISTETSICCNSNERPCLQQVRERDMSHIWMSHVAYINVSCCIYEWVMSHIWLLFAMQMGTLRSCTYCESTHLHVPISWGNRYMNGSFHTYDECVNCFVSL